MSEWLDAGFPPRGHAILVEDRYTERDYTVRAELPGIDPDKDVRVSVASGVLTIHAERHEEKKEANRSEFRYGAFDRSVRLPANAEEEKIQAEYRDGILAVTVPLSAPEPAGRQITVTKN